MIGINYVIDDKGRQVAVLIDLKTLGAMWEDFRDRLMSESRRTGKSISQEQYRASRAQRAWRSA